MLHRQDRLGWVQDTWADRHAVVGEVQAVVAHGTQGVPVVTS